MITESITIKGSLNIVVFDQNNNVKDTRDIKNLVVASGKNYIANRMTSNANVIMSHMAIGSGNASPTTSDTTLGSEDTRIPLDSTTLTGNTITYVTTYGAGVGTGPITEAGIFNDPTAGTMLCRTRFDVVNKANTDVVVITWNVTVG
jgi:hypothetical protein